MKKGELDRYVLLSSMKEACGQRINDPKLLQERVNEHLKLGYGLVGSPYAAHGFQYQAVYK